MLVPPQPDPWLLDMDRKIEIFFNVLEFEKGYINIMELELKKNRLVFETRGSVGWGCVAHRSFCFEET